ncbi:DUF3054 domain-containing protein [Arthrobacter caoxuetaonis]|uniref:DUF3054 domain-containing protein n=1 Tax=Arthrobacter caoxuetaonis TaxID=2886935 RepID=UPI001D150050|nr:DUF3054 domain-containing protein [Arthrobacter caoxuetaonis]
MSTRRFWPAFLAADVVLILVFAALGRDTHAHGLDPAGVAVTASPFIAACLAGWLLLRAWHRPYALWPTGILLWLITAGGRPGHPCGGRRRYGAQLPAGDVRRAGSLPPCSAARGGGHARARRAQFH